MASDETTPGSGNYIDTLMALIQMDEESQYLPQSSAILREHMQEALEAGKTRFGTTSSPESDRYRHIVGMREAALDPEVGGISALAGGLGHEANNLRKAIMEGDLRQLGSRSSQLGLMQILRNSWDDAYNNWVGISSAYQNPDDLTDADLLSLLDEGLLPADLRTPDPSAVTIQQDPNLRNPQGGYFK